MMKVPHKLTDEHLEQIASFIAKKFPAIKGRGRSKHFSRDIEIEIRERIVRVEEELKNQRDLIREMMNNMNKRFEMIDKHFEIIQSDMNIRFESVQSDMNTRFEMVQSDMNKRFTMMMWFTGAGFTMVTAFITGAVVFFK